MTKERTEHPQPTTQPFVHHAQQDITKIQGEMPHVCHVYRANTMALTDSKIVQIAKLILIRIERSNLIVPSVPSVDKRSGEAQHLANHAVLGFMVPIVRPVLLGNFAQGTQKFDNGHCVCFCGVLIKLF